MYALVRWGARTLGPPKHDDELYPEWGLNGLPALFNGEEARGLTETYVLKRTTSSPRGSCTGRST